MLSACEIYHGTTLNPSSASSTVNFSVFAFDLDGSFTLFVVTCDFTTYFNLVHFMFAKWATFLTEKHIQWNPPRLVSQRVVNNELITVKND